MLRYQHFSALTKIIWETSLLWTSLQTCRGCPRWKYCYIHNNIYWIENTNGRIGRERWALSHDFWGLLWKPNHYSGYERSRTQWKRSCKASHNRIAKSLDSCDRCLIQVSYELGSMIVVAVVELDWQQQCLLAVPYEIEMDRKKLDCWVLMQVIKN